MSFTGEPVQTLSAKGEGVLIRSIQYMVTDEKDTNARLTLFIGYDSRIAKVELIGSYTERGSNGKSSDN